jgi:methyl-accepting chemotaxis protein
MLSLKSKMRLISGLIFICFVALGLLAINRLALVSEASSIVTNLWHPRARIIKEMEVIAREYRISEALRILSETPEMAEHADSDLRANSDLFLSKLANYRKLRTPGESRTSADKIEQSWRQYIDSNNQMLAYARNNQHREATNRFVNSASRFYLLGDALDAVSASDDQNGKATSEAAIRTYKQAALEVLTVLGAIALLLFGFAVYFELNVWRTLSRLSSVMKHLAEGDFQTTVRGVARKDEIGEMASAVQVFKNNGLEKLRLEGETQIQRIAAEDMRRQNDETLATLEGQRTFAVASIARGLDELSKGNLAFRLTDAFAPEFQKLRDDFNLMTDHIALLVGQVQKSETQVRTSMTEISATSKEQQATASEIAATTAQVGTTSREISATSKELVKTMNEVSTGAEQTASLAGDGQTSLKRMEATMRQVMDAAGSINSKLAVLNEKASNINQVVTTIAKVADQTNLLSLNAAIEAEKAGEYGRGFAVVATEIRRLADQTGIATYDIEQIVKEIQSAVSTSVMGMDKFSEEVRRGMQDVEQVGGQLLQIIQQVQSLAPRFEAVSEGMQAQATGAEQISEGLLQLTEAAQQTVSSLRQSSFAIDELNAVSGGLHNSVSRFQVQAQLGA